MLIKLLNKYPIIVVDEARVLGQMMGVVLEDNKVTGILSASEYRDKHYHCASSIDKNKYIHIPIDAAIIGPDAFLIKTFTDANIHFSCGQVIEVVTCVYTCTGEFVGNVTGVEISPDYTLKSIRIEGSYIKSDRIKKIGDVIIIDSETVITREVSKSEDNTVFINISGDENEENIRDTITSEEDSSSDYLEEISYTTTENPSDYIESSEEELSEAMSDSVYSKYKYLLGKKLVSSIDIADKIYSEDSVIDAELIKLAINNNCILSLIMNAEE